MDRRRAAFIVTAALVATAGCASVLGLEDRHLEGATGADGGGDVVGGDAAMHDGAVLTDAAVDVVSDSPCGSSISVYEFDTDVGGRGYVVNRDDAPQGKTTKRAFGLLDPRFPLRYSQVFHALRNDAGDYLVSSRVDEATGYVKFEDLANIGDDDEAGAPPPIRIIERFLDEAGTAHRFARAGESQDGWVSDNHLWWVCP